MSVMSLAARWPAASRSLLVCRLVQGIGVGGEMPVAAVYINELSKARGRGRFFLLYEMIFPIGLMVTGQIGARAGADARLAGDVPHRRHSGAGHHWLLLRLPESPRWLIAKRPVRGGRGDRPRDGGARADPAAPPVRQPAERPTVPSAARAPPVAQRGTGAELLGRVYRRRTLVVWTLWASAYFITNGLNNWMPTLYNRVYGLDLATVAPRRQR